MIYLNKLYWQIKKRKNLCFSLKMRKKRRARRRFVISPGNCERQRLFSWIYKINFIAYSIFYQWGSNRSYNIDGAEVVRVAHNAILVSRMHLATIALLCKQTTDNFQTRHPPEPRWRHLSGNWILFVPHWRTSILILKWDSDELSWYYHINLCVIIWMIMQSKQRTLMNVN